MRVCVCVDCIGVVKSVSDVQKITSKQTQKEIVKRDVFIVDQSLMQVRLTLWGADVSLSACSIAFNLHMCETKQCKFKTFE